MSGTTPALLSEYSDICNIGTSPLIYAILYNKKKSAEFLIKSGADLELEDFMGNCAKKMLQN